MKFILGVILIFQLFTNNILAQSYLKAGINLNSDIVNHKLGKLVYPSYEINYERGLGKHFSISLGYNYSLRSVSEENYESSYYPSYTEWNNYNHAIIPEGRYYFKSNKDGFFIQAGLPYTISIEQDKSNGLNGALEN